MNFDAWWKQLNEFWEKNDIDRNDLERQAIARAAWEASQENTLNLRRAVVERLREEAGRVAGKITWYHPEHNLNQLADEVERM